MSDPPNIPEPVRSAVLTRIAQYGISAVALGTELLMQEGCGSVDDFVVNIGTRYGDDEAERVRTRIRDLGEHDAQALRGSGQGRVIDRRHTIAQNLTRYALIAAPDAEFVNGIEIALNMVAERYAEPGTARGSEAMDEVGWSIDQLFTKRNVPYRYELGKLLWVGDRGARDVVLEPALQALGDTRLAGSRAEFEAALAHLRAGTQKDLEDAIDEAAKSVESAFEGDGRRDRHGCPRSSHG